MINTIQRNPKKIFTLTEKQLESVLNEADDFYYNSKKTILEDHIYDLAKERLQLEFPDNPFHKSVGAPIKKGDKIKLPYWLGSMDKIKPELNNLNRWMKKYNGPYAIMDKLDGVSGLFVITNSSQHLFTRGDGEYGQDISHLIKYLNLPKNNFKKWLKTSKNYKISIRGELIINKKNFAKFSKSYSNARSATAGLVNAKNPNKKILKFLEFVAYEVIEPRTNIKSQLKFLEDLKLNTVVHHFVDKIDNDYLSNALTERRESGLYDIDGIIVCDNDIHPVNDAGNPDFAFAYKTVFSGQLTETVVLDILWRPSKDGCIVPKVAIVPVVIGGIYITHTTGHNARYIVENGIGPGAIVLVKRAGDVVPNIHQVLKPAKIVMPKDDYIWDKTDTNIYLTDIESNDYVKLRRVIKFFEKLDVKHVSKKTCEKIFNHGYKTIIDIINIQDEEFKKISGFGGKMGTKILNSLHEKLNNINLVDLMDASNCFGRGLGKKKIKNVIESYPDILNYKLSREDIEEVEGFSVNTSKMFTSNFKDFIKFYNQILDNITITTLWEDGPEFSNDDSSYYSDDEYYQDETLPIWGSEVVFTNLTDIEDIEIFNTIEEYGLTIKRRITKNTDYVVSSSETVNKKILEKCQMYDLEIIDISTFKTLFD